MLNQRRYLVLIPAIALLIFSIVRIPSNVSGSDATIVDVPLTFHAYREHNVNASSYFYDGVDSCPPQYLNAVSSTVEAHIYGTIKYPPFGTFDSWRGQVTWNLTAPLAADLHVQGTVTMSVWVSSTDEISGFFTGSGYGGAITDIDAQDNAIQIFEFPYAQQQGSNIFSPTPTEYQMSLDLDYVFAQNHIILFSFGFGSNVEGLTATIYFDAPDRRSGVMLPVRDLAVNFCNGQPKISVTPTMWTETLSTNTNRTKTFRIENVDNGSLFISAILESVPWLSLTQDPTPLWVPPGNSTTFSVEMRATNVTEIANTVITVSSNDPDEGYYDIPVTMKVGILDVPPTVDLVVPDMATVDELITILVNATAHHGVAAIYAFFNGSWHNHNCYGQKNCSFIWTTHESSPGRYYYKAKVQDTLGQWSNIVESPITFSAQVVHQDLGIIDYTIPTSIVKGDTVTFSTLIQNHGNQQETSTISFTINTTTIYQTSILLAPGNSTSITYQWTAPPEIATATFHMTVDPLPAETNLADNEVIIILQIRNPQDSLPWIPITTVLIVLSFFGVIIARRLRQYTPLKAVSRSRNPC